MISVVIPCCNEEHCEYTVQSILDNAAGPVEVIVVDDNCPREHVFPAGVVHVRTPGPHHGVDVARHFGIQLAKFDILVIMDAHMSVEPGWDRKVMEHFRADDVACVSCRHDPDHWTDPSEWGYMGAWMQAKMDDPAYYGHSILQPKWATGAAEKIKAGERSPIPCVLGAFYVFTKAAYAMMGEPWQYLRLWGWSEQLLSVAAFSVGLNTVVLPIKTGHCYRMHGPRPFVIPSWSTLFNQYLLAYTLPMSAELRGELLSHLDEDRKAGKYAAMDYKLCDDMLELELPCPLKSHLADKRPLDEYLEHWDDFR